MGWPTSDLKSPSRSAARRKAVGPGCPRPCPGRPVLVNCFQHDDSPPPQDDFPSNYDVHIRFSQPPVARARGRGRLGDVFRKAWRPPAKPICPPMLCTCVAAQTRTMFILNSPLDGDPAIPEQWRGVLKIPFFPYPPGPVFRTTPRPKKKNTKNQPAHGPPPFG